MSNASFHISRRRFLKTSLVGAALPAWYLAEHRDLQAAPRPLAENDKPGVALVGCGGMGRGDAGAASYFGQIVALCDVDQRQLDAAAQQFKVSGNSCYTDFRRVMERDDVHIVLTGTPDHWHTLVNLAAVKAGKDIYTEKPLTLTIDEGRRLVEAVRAKGTVLQVGSQQRSDKRFRFACELVRNGRIGKLQHMIVGLPTGPREGPFSAERLPEGLNWDAYLGQTPQVDYNGHNCHWNFRWWYQFSGGQMTDWGAHHCDIAQWGNGSERTGPVEIDGRGLVDMIPGGYDAIAEFEVHYKYGNGVTMTLTDGKRAPNGVKFVGTDGWIFVSREKIEAAKPEILEERLPENAVRLHNSSNHMGNFFECVRSRRDPICDVEIGHRSISVAHLGVISIRLGRALRWDPDQQQFVGDEEANRWLSRTMRAPYDYSYAG